MQNYILRDLNDPSKLKTEGRTHRGDAICTAPEGEEIEWLSLEDVTDDITGSVLGQRAVVDETKKAEVLAARELRKGAQLNQRTMRADREFRMRWAYKNMDKVLEDPVKLKKLLKEMLITLANLEEE